MNVKELENKIRELIFTTDIERFKQLCTELGGEISEWRRGKDEVSYTCNLDAVYERYGKTILHNLGLVLQLTRENQLNLEVNNHEVPIEHLERVEIPISTLFLLKVREGKVSELILPSMIAFLLYYPLEV